MSPLTYTLALDASIYVGTVAVWNGDGALVEGAATMRGAEEERLMPAVAETLSRAGVHVRELRDVVCGGGPGSFTSLRIAAAIAKGIVAARGDETTLWSVPSLALLVARDHRAPGRYLAALDAMRGEWYAQPFDVGDDGSVRVAGDRLRLETAALEGHAAEHGLTLLRGSDAAPQARGVARIARSAWERVSLESWEPDYGRLAEAQVKWEATHGRPLLGEHA